MNSTADGREGTRTNQSESVAFTSQPHGYSFSENALSADLRRLTQIKNGWGARSRELAKVGSGIFFSTKFNHVIICLRMWRSKFPSPLGRAVAACFWHALGIGFVLAIIGSAPVRGAEAAAFSIAPPSGWVKSQFFDPRAASGLPDAGSDEHVLLLERQINVRENEMFAHALARSPTGWRRIGLAIICNGCTKPRNHWAIP